MGLKKTEKHIRTVWLGNRLCQTGWLRLPKRKFPRRWITRISRYSECVKLSYRARLQQWPCPSLSKPPSYRLYPFQESDHLKSIFSYLTGKQISRACREAQLHGDYRLSLLLSQVTGNTFTRNLLYKQLADWQEMKVRGNQSIKKKTKQNNNNNNNNNKTILKEGEFASCISILFER